MFENILWGARWGALFGIVFVVFVLALFLVLGGELQAVTSEEIGEVLVVTFALSFSGGILAGILRPILKLGTTGAAVMGFIVAVILSAVVNIILYQSLWAKEDIISIFLTATLLGPTVGVVYYKMFHS